MQSDGPLPGLWVLSVLRGPLELRWCELRGQPCLSQSARLIGPTDYQVGMATLHKKVMFVTGASRGIGLAIALRAARDGASVAIAAKTTEPHPKLPGTIYTAAEEIRQAGGRALPIACDIRFAEQ